MQLVVPGRSGRRGRPGAVHHHDTRISYGPSSGSAPRRPAPGCQCVTRCGL